ncbi:MAG: hypothetical protein LUE99_14165 [Bacteroides sp.]|nr:hypothetical protein [Bacteroides sp.]
MSDTVFPRLRNASICTVYFRPMKHPDPEERPALVSADMSVPCDSALCCSAPYDSALAVMLSAVEVSPPLCMLREQMLRLRSA